LILGIPNPDCIYFDYYGLSEESDWSEHLYAWDLKQGFRFITNCGFQVEKVYCNFPFSERFGKLWNSLPLTKRYSADLWFVATKTGKKVRLRTPHRNILEKSFRKILGNAMSQPPIKK
jgi:hypothetical protein